MIRLFLTISCLFALSMSASAANSQKNFGGVGIDGVPLQNGQIVVRQVVIGSPAHQAGIQVGDIITHIDGKATIGSDFQTMVQKRLRGLSGTEVVLKTSRQGEKKNMTFRLVRRQLQISGK